MGPDGGAGGGSVCWNGACLTVILAVSSLSGLSLKRGRVERKTRSDYEILYCMKSFTVPR